MPRDRYSQPKQFLHFVQNSSDHDSDGKLFKIKPILDAVRNEFIKIEPEQFRSEDDQLIPSKTKFTMIRQYNPKKSRNWGFKNLVWTGWRGFIYNFYLYSGREEVNENSGYSHLYKYAQGYTCYFDNWFGRLELFIYFGRIGIDAAGRIRANYLQGCLYSQTKIYENKA